MSEQQVPDPAWGAGDLPGIAQPRFPPSRCSATMVAVASGGEIGVVLWPAL